MGHFSSTSHRGKYRTISTMMKVFAVSCLLALAGAAPKPEAEADAQFIAAAPYHATVPAANCKTDIEVLVTQTCVPTAENVCNTETVETEEIEYEKVCKEVVDTICDQPAVVPAAVGYHAIAKREADAEADPQFFAHPYAAHAVAAPLAAAHVAAVAPAAAHAVTATVKHACREVTTEHCVDNPKIKIVPVE